MQLRNFWAPAAAASSILAAEPAPRSIIGEVRLSKTLIDQLTNLTTPHLADGCLRTGVPIRFAPADVKALTSNMKCRGRALPVRHVGSIDIFFEAFEKAEQGDVLLSTMADASTKHALAISSYLKQKRRVSPAS